MGDELTIVSPLRGTVYDLAHVPDEVFAGQLVGAGIALNPQSSEEALNSAGGTQVKELTEVHAPVGGRIASLFPHAFALEVNAGRTVLVHLGIDTVTLKGTGFQTHVAVGDEVRAGDLIATWDPQQVVIAGLSTLSPIIALQAATSLVTVHVEPGDQVNVGQPLFTWR